MKRTSLFIIGSDLVPQQHDMHTDQSFHQELCDLVVERSMKFIPSTQNMTLGESLTAADNRWEYDVGDLVANSASVTIRRFWPDWCLTVHGDVQEEFDALSSVLEAKFSHRYLDGPADVVTLDSSTGITVDNSKNASLIDRTANDYTGRVSSVESSTVTIQGVPAKVEKDILNAILVLEYDVRAMKRDLLDLRVLRPSVDALTEALRRRYLSLMYGGEDSVPFNASVDVDELAREVRTFCSDVFTCVHDLEVYCEDLDQLMSTTVSLTEWYRSVGRECGRRAVLAQAEVSRLVEFMKHLG